MTLKICVKSKIVFWQPRYYNLLTEKGKKSCVFETLLSLKTYLLSISRSFIQTPSPDDILSGILHGQIQLFN